MKKKLSGRKNRVIGKVTAVLKRAGQSFRITGYREMNENATFSSQLFVNGGKISKIAQEGEIFLPFLKEPIASLSVQWNIEDSWFSIKCLGGSRRKKRTCCAHESDQNSPEKLVSLVSFIYLHRGRIGNYEDRYCVLSHVRWERRHRNRARQGTCCQRSSNTFH